MDVGAAMMAALSEQKDRDEKAWVWLVLRQTVENFGASCAAINEAGGDLTAVQMPTKLSWHHHTQLKMDAAGDVRVTPEPDVEGTLDALMRELDELQ